MGVAIDTTKKTITITPEPKQELSFEARLELARIAIDVACERHLIHLTDEGAAILAATQTRPHNNILTAAHAELLTHGWHQGGYEGPDGPICALAAIDRNAVCGPRRSEATRLLMDRITEAHGVRYTSIHAWNDDPSTTMDDVLALMY